jgi:hypothetical protein
VYIPITKNFTIKVCGRKKSPLFLYITIRGEKEKGTERGEKEKETDRGEKEKETNRGEKEKETDSRVEKEIERDRKR